MSRPLSKAERDALRDMLRAGVRPKLLRLTTGRGVRTLAKIATSARAEVRP